MSFLRLAPWAELGHDRRDLVVRHLEAREAEDVDFLLLDMLQLMIKTPVEVLVRLQELPEVVLVLLEAQAPAPAAHLQHRDVVDLVAQHCARRRSPSGIRFGDRSPRC